MTRQSSAGLCAPTAVPELQAILTNVYRFIAIDVETANPDAGSICQIGMACVGARGVEEVVTLLIDPCCDFAPMNVQIHGIRPEHVAGRPLFSAFLDAAGAFLARHMLVQHSAFDGRAIRRATEACGRPPAALKWHDSVLVARRAWPEFKGNGGHGLGHLKAALGLEFRHHDAGEDARAAAEVILRAEARMGLPFAEILATPSGAAAKAPARTGAAITRRPA
ncbi:exonuclease domain-containing protein [Frigidibacter sp. MR17.24]|uniref:exonuclease domain-containing protein n=1 Tax=Frigidibacter sp. MR17.24 TaxID=3127345 RepID=UPI003012DF22